MQRPVSAAASADAFDNQLVITAPGELGEAIDLFKNHGRRSATIYYDGSGRAVAEVLIAEFARHGLPAPSLSNSADAANTTGLDGLFFATDDAPGLSSSLTRLGKARDLFVWAPKTRHYFKSRPAFVQSVPKSGTHVLFECLKAFGYVEPPSLDLPDFEAPLLDGVFYNLQHMPMACLSPSYQRFPQFIEALSRSVVVFIVRDPRDVAVSLAHYLASQTEFHITAALFRGMPADERVSRVLTGAYPIPIYLNRHMNLTGGIHELFAPYLAWWSGVFPNVWRLRYEDVIGPNGGGDKERQLQTIWELQLALHVPGRPSDYSDRVFSRKSLTFRRGQIASYLADFSPRHHELFQQSAGDLLGALGYAERWKITRPFSVRFPPACELSATAAAQLRSAFAGHGRGFSSITVQEDDESDRASSAPCLEVETSRTGQAVLEDRVSLSMELRNDVSGGGGELVGTDPSRYSLRISKPQSPQSLATAAIKTLVKLGCIDRLPEERSAHEFNTRFEGEIRLAIDGNAAAPILRETNYRGHNLVQYLGHFYAVPIALGPLDLSATAQRLDSFLCADSLADLRAMVTNRTLLGYIGHLEGVTEAIEPRLKALEDAIAERTQRLASLESTLDERTNRLVTLEQNRGRGWPRFWRSRRRNRP